METLRQTDGDRALDREALRQRQSSRQGDSQTDRDRALDRETLRQTDGDRDGVLDRDRQMKTETEF